jgi:hypothetical protein
MTSVLQLNELPQRPERHRAGRPLTDTEVTIVAAICNRLARMLGNLDRDGLYTDLEIVQNHCPINLAALAAAPDRAFIDEITRIIESTDRSTGSLRDDFTSRYLSAAQTA